MTRLIDADKLKIDYGFTWDDITPTHEEMYALIDRQPTIEAVQVIRCKDCKWADWYIACNGNKYCHCEETGFEVSGLSEDDFCSFAERKEP